MGLIRVYRINDKDLAKLERAGIKVSLVSAETETERMDATKKSTKETLNLLEKAATFALKRRDEVTVKKIRLQMLRLIKGGQNETA